MSGIKKGEEQGDDHSLDVPLPEVINDAENGVLIQRHDDPAVLVDSFEDPFSQVPRHQRRRVIRTKIKSRLFRPGHSPDLQDILKSRPW